MKTILLTGATGYLGGYLAKNFLDEGFFVIALALNKSEQFKWKDYDNQKVYYLDDTNIKEIFAKEKIDIVIHTATRYGRSREDNVDMVKANLEFPLEVLEEAVKHNVGIFVNTDTILEKSINAYSLTKNQFTDWLKMYSDKIKCINLRLDHFYGPNDNPVKFIAWLIQQFSKNVAKIDLTEGAQIRDFIYIDDVVSAFDTVIQNSEKLPIGKVNNFEVGTNVKTSIKDLVLMIKEKMGNTVTKLNFGAIPYRKNEVLDYDIDTSSLKHLGWIPGKTLQQGLNEILSRGNK